MKFLVLSKWSYRFVLLVVGIRNSAYKFWPLDRVHNCVIQLVLAHSEDCRCKVRVEMQKF